MIRGMKIGAALLALIFWFGVLGPMAVSSESTIAGLSWAVTTVFGLFGTAGYIIQRFNHQQNKGEKK